MNNPNIAIAILGCAVLALGITVTMLHRRYNAMARFFSDHREIGREWKRFMGKEFTNYSGR